MRTDILKVLYYQDSSKNLQVKDHEELYFLFIGIYPPWSIFVNKISECSTQKETSFFESHEAMRKDVNREFGVFYYDFRELWKIID